MSLQQLRRLFMARREPLASKNFNQKRFIESTGTPQLNQATKYMFEQESQLGPLFDYLQQIYEGKIDPQMRESTLYNMLSFAFKTELLDQTILQAQIIFDQYLAKNKSVNSKFLSLIAITAIEIAVKNNEDKLLSLETCMQVFENMYTLQMFQNLEQHILVTLQFKMNMPTSLDYTLQFVLQYRDVWIQQQPQQLTFQAESSTSVSSHADSSATVTRPQIDPMHLVNLCLPCLHFAQINYQTSLCRQASMAVASVCFIIQDITEQDSKNSFMTQDNKKALEQQTAIHRALRNEWLQHLQADYGDLLDFKEIFMIIEYFLTTSAEESAQQEAKIFVAQQQQQAESQQKMVRKPWKYNPEDIDDEEVKNESPSISEQLYPNIASLNLNSPAHSTKTNLSNCSATRDPFKANSSNQITQKQGPEDNQSSEEEESSHYSGKGSRRPRRAAKPERVNRAITKKAKSPTSEMNTITKRIKSPSNRERQQQ